MRTHPLSWHCQRPHPPGLVLGYAASPPATIAATIAAAIAEGIAAIGAALRAVR